MNLNHVLSRHYEYFTIIVNINTNSVIIVIIIAIIISNENTIAAAILGE